MRNSTQYPRNGAAKRCAICDGKFGLIRYYSWRNFPLFKEVRRSLQVARGGRPQMVAPFSSCATDSCRRNHRVSTQGGRAMSFLCKGGTT